MKNESEVRALKSQALDELAVRSHDLKRARGSYEAGLWKAHHLGIPNTIIARCVGRTEAAVRMYFKRNPQGLTDV